MKHRSVSTTSEYYNAIPRKFKEAAKVVLAAWAKDYLENDKLSFDDFVNELVPHFYECWRIILTRQVARSLFIAAIQKIEPAFTPEAA